MKEILKMFGKRIVLATCISVFLIVLMFSAMTVSTSTYTVGVKAGDWARFGDISFEWESNMPGYEPPPELNMSWVDIEVLDVSDSNVTVRSTIIYENGTEQADVMSGNVATGEGNLSVGIIPSSLGASDKIPANLTWCPFYGGIFYTRAPLKLVIYGTGIRSYAGANREVNYASITYIPETWIPENYVRWEMSFCWDKETGIMCESRVSYYAIWYMFSYVNISMLYRMTATNMWPAVFTVENGYTFNVTTISNSTISNFNFNELLKQISFNVTGPAGKAGYCNVTIPKDLLRDCWTILLNGTDWTTSCSITENDTHTFIYIPYPCSTNTIQIRGTWVVPEFSSAMILPLLMIATMFSVVLCRRRRKT